MAGPSRILSEAQVEEMIELRERGRSLAAIAAHFTAAGTQISDSAIGWQCMIAGADLPPGRRRPLQRGRPSMRNGFPIRPFTPEEDAKLVEMDRRRARDCFLSRYRELTPLVDQPVAA